LKDAVRVVQELQIQYLLVDALCILQDEDMDKALEISRMANTYGYAYITIAASRARDTQEGFLHSRKPVHNPNQVIRLSYRCRDGQLGSVYLYKSPGVGWTEPIDNRAWTLQESLLSPRALEYGRLQTRWSCETASHGPIYVDGWESSKLCHRTVKLSMNDLTNSPWSQLRTIISQLIGNGQNGEWGKWKDIVEAYTKRNLTRSTDRLLALSGIAEKFITQAGCEYIAGLWKASLPSSLLWYTYKEWRSISHHCLVKYIAPSWSWASVEGSIFFNPAGPDSKNLRAEVIEVKVIPALPNCPYGAVVGGFLTIRSRVRSAILAIRSENLLDPEVNSSVPASIKLDAVIDKSKDWLAVMLLELYKCNPDYQDLSSGLLLCRVDAVTFRRIGIFRLEPANQNRQKWLEYRETFDRNGYYPISPSFHYTPNWFDGCQQCSVTII
jgi:heterokaryon incompatibility protein (HET)